MEVIKDEISQTDTPIIEKEVVPENDIFSGPFGRFVIIKNQNAQQPHVELTANKFKIPLRLQLSVKVLTR